VLRALILVWMLSVGSASAACRQSLALALDVSASVDAREYVLQLEGVALALEDPAVRAALLDLPDAPVSLAVFEWSGGSYQRLIQDWINLGSLADIAVVTARLRGWQRDDAPETTGLGAAMEYAATLQARAPDCWRRVLDISGDGTNNDWPLPRDVRASGRLGDMTINALVIGETPQRGDGARHSQIAELTAYFKAEILYGPDAFLETALGFEDYAAAMARKLIRELQVLPIGLAPDGSAATRLAAIGQTPYQ
jgi:hypothetical protein